jgi:hypothetical protein
MGVRQMTVAYVVLVIVAVSSAAFLFIRPSRAAAAEPTGATTFEQRFAGLPADALERRARSNATMRTEGVPLNEWLPTIESEQDVELPSTEEVAMRAAANLVVAMKGHGMRQAEVDKLVQDYGLVRWFSPNEAKFVGDPNPDEQDRQVQTWRYEAANALLWAIGRVDRLNGPRTLVDPRELTKLILESSKEQFLAKANLRSKSEILDQADLIYRYRWALADARLHNRASPPGLNDDVAMERHQAFNWLIEHSETAWDDISLDT